MCGGAVFTTVPSGFAMNSAGTGGISTITFPQGAG